jgi:hypothetical protein
LVEKIPDYRIIISTKIYFYEDKKIPNYRDDSNAVTTKTIVSMIFKIIATGIHYRRKQVLPHPSKATLTFSQIIT